ncbi:MAG: PIN domain-containing protein [Ginsengibacter sp.]
MKDSYFIDSNILIYAHTMQDDRKKKIAQEILSLEYEILLNTQVVNESINVFIKRFEISLNDIKKIIAEIIFYLPVRTINTKTIEGGLDIHKKYQYSYYDSLIIASALENKCSILYSEDLQHNQKIEESLTIINPFV